MFRNKIKINHTQKESRKNMIVTNNPNTTTHYNTDDESLK